MSNEHRGDPAILAALRSLGNLVKPDRDAEPALNDVHELLDVPYTEAEVRAAERLAGWNRTEPGRCLVSSTERGQCTRHAHADARHEYNDLDRAAGRWAGNSPSHRCTYVEVGALRNEQCVLFGGHPGDHNPQPLPSIPAMPPNSTPGDRPQWTPHDTIANPLDPIAAAAWEAYYEHDGAFGYSNSRERLGAFRSLPRSSQSAWRAVAAAMLSVLGEVK